MVIQEAQLNTPDTCKRERPRSRTLAAISAGTAAAALLAVIGVYFAAFHPLPTTVSWAPAGPAVAPGGDLAVSGRVTPAMRGRRVLFESSLDAHGPWQPMSQAATTDARGSFAITFKPHLSGPFIMHVVVDQAGRYLKVTGQSKYVRLLSPSTISLKGGGRVTNQIPVNFTVAVDPKTVGRTVRLEQSSDKVHWVRLGPSAQTQADGTTLVKVPRLAIGVWSYRAAVAQDDKFAASVSSLAGATVEDIKVVAARAAASRARAALRR